MGYSESDGLAADIHRSQLVKGDLTGTGQKVLKLPESKE